ncbi:mitochondrial RNA pseudouridine synthase rpusd4-like [Orussus abietinus]|uniref:mitochondrial RNA pseudouridine synthase rpusd4-like n=1 Tax=Orussus abietinus TaxID=222816 RepID=UPI0006259803|nr:mitochondrial RNA pseudouridine synthase rpusd4-like [Orussus abietinus]
MRMKSLARCCFAPSFPRLCRDQRYEALLNKYYTTRAKEATERKIHPYKNVHPWKSVDQFSNELVCDVIYNKDGLIAINKPYGISGKNNTNINGNGADKKIIPHIPNAVDYTLSDAIPYIAKTLGYQSLKLIKSLERYTAGIILLAESEKVENAVIKSFNRAQGFGIIPKTYWVVTTKLPREVKGIYRLGLTLQQSPCRTFKQAVFEPVIGKNREKRGEVNIFKADFKLISNSTLNLCSLIEIKASPAKWHSVRLFSSTILYSPILGDQIYGSRVQNVMGTWVNIGPFNEVAQRPPVLSRDLLHLLELTPKMTPIVPAHVHLRRIELPWFYGKGKDLILEARLRPEFLWTCKKLQFKHVEEIEKEFPEESIITC